MKKPTILTGLRANNDLTLGNYFGGILPIVEMADSMADDYQINMFIPDLHSFTTPIDHGALQEQVLHNARLFVAAGLPLDNDEILLYRQSYIPAHSELTWILDCFTGMGEMERMTQYKDKSRKLYKENSEYYNNQLAGEHNSNEMQVKIDDVVSVIGHRVSVGLFNYPVLMAADILLYGATYVPVGDDQSQHLEFTRDIAERINKRFGDIFTLPVPVAKQHEFFQKGQGLRIMDLADPTKKMSKSDDSGKGVIFLGDEPEAAAKKIMAATTDDKAEIHFDKQTQPGVSNLLQILALIRGRSLQQVTSEFEGQTRYGDFKQVVAGEVKQFLEAFQGKLHTVEDEKIIAKLEQSEVKAAETANATLLRVQQAVGLRSKAS